jgi:hypothetical protein
VISPDDGETNEITKIVGGSVNNTTTDSGSNGLTTSLPESNRPQAKSDRNGSFVQNHSLMMQIIRCFLNPLLCSCSPPTIDSLIQKTGGNLSFPNRPQRRWSFATDGHRMGAAVGKFTAGAGR